jgi:hypothetical protein
LVKKKQKMHLINVLNYHVEDLSVYTDLKKWKWLDPPHSMTTKITWNPGTPLLSIRSLTHQDPDDTYYRYHFTGPTDTPKHTHKSTLQGLEIHPNMPTNPHIP